MLFSAQYIQGTGQDDHCFQLRSHGIDPPKRPLVIFPQIKCLTGSPGINQVESGIWGCSEAKPQ